MRTLKRQSGQACQLGMKFALIWLMDAHEGLKMVTCSISMHLSPNGVDKVIELIFSVLGQIQAKPQCRVCTVERDPSQENWVHYREEWESEKAFRRHTRSPEFHRILVAMDLCLEEPQIVIGNMTAHYGMEYLKTLRCVEDGIEHPWNE